MYAVVDNKKTCSKCKEVKDLSSFTNNKKCTGGKQSQCNDCWKDYKREYYKKIKIAFMGI